MFPRFSILFLLSLWFTSPVALFSQEVETWDVTQLLGLTPPQAMEILGIPTEIYPLKVTETQWQPILYYPKNIYLFLHQNRVWQLRLDNRYTEAFQGIKMGMGKLEIVELMGPPLGEEETFLIYNLKYKNFPRRLRLILSEGKLTDIFVYRSDF
ncbi:MAG: hypothetical protein A2Z96_02195 [Spirochaetes bacterium GWB1_48_6]|nr:MAG: hypothetical protein A2Z96_02195 [Spirochaetes bacterium GWB1_48_6]